ncbi:TMEM86A.2 family protein [Megaselia abdita]
MAKTCAFSILLKLLPFLTTTALYFGFVTKDPEGELWTTVLKCLPIFGLMLFIGMHKMNSILDCYGGKILLGLTFSVTGDALLNLDLFPHGMGAFAVAQICYIAAYGLKPVKFYFAIPFYALGIAMYVVVFEKLDVVLKVGLPIYAFLLTSMVWRSVVQASTKPNFFNILCAFGSFMFAVSDGFIAIDKFYTPIPHARYYIMTTYYFAQCAITLSIVNRIGETD